MLTCRRLGPCTFKGGSPKVQASFGSSVRGRQLGGVKDRRRLSPEAERRVIILTLSVIVSLTTLFTCFPLWFNRRIEKIRSGELLLED